MKGTIFLNPHCQILRDVFSYRDEERRYDTMQVCVNGHPITKTLKSHPEDGQKHCEQCGSETISKCKKCETDIRGHCYDPNATFSSNTPIPDYCHKCSEPYPWQGKLETSTKSDEIDPSKVIVHLFSRLPEVIRQLRNRYNGRSTLDVQDEYDLQNLLHSLLKINFDDVRPEEYTPSYAGAASRMDFLLPNEKIVIETKMTRDSLSRRTLSQELIDDKERYKKHADCEILHCLVYDPNRCVDNPRGFENDISEEYERFACKVTIVS